MRGRPNGARKALDEARALFRKSPTPAHEERLVRAAAERARELAGRGMDRDAEQLLELTRQRHPALAGLLRDATLSGVLRTGTEGDVLRFLREEATDLSEVAATPGLAPDLRREAAVVLEAFRAVTSGPVAPEQVALPEVSRRSPFACWKMLIRAIEAWHRQEDALCRRCLDAVPEGSVPHRLVVPLRQALEGRPPAWLAGLRRPLEALESDPARALAHAAEAMALARRSFPDLAPRLHQDLALRLGRTHPAGKVNQALGGAPPRDARLLRLRALQEEKIDPRKAAALWEEFRQAAPLPPLEEAALLRRQALFLDAAGATLGRVHPLDLHRRAAEIDPHSEGFSAWLALARRYRGKHAQEAARAWSAACPEQVEPLLFLAEADFQSGAFKRARGWLDRAEAANPLDPRLRRLRLRVDVSFAIRHLCQRKFHLAEADLAALEARRADHGPDLEVLLPWLRWGLLHLTERPREAAVQADLLDQALGSRRVAHAFRDCLADPAEAAPKERGALLAPAGRAARLAREAGYRLPVSKKWVAPLVQELSQAALPPEDLLALTEAAILATAARPFAEAAVQSGLQLPGPWAARFLLRRTEILAGWEKDRFFDCLQAAATLARHEGDEETVATALQRLQKEFEFASPIDLAVAEEILAAERSGQERPRPACDCPRCRGEEEFSLERLLEALEIVTEELGADPARRSPRRQGLLFEEAG